MQADLKWTKFWYSEMLSSDSVRYTIVQNRNMVPTHNYIVGPYGHGPTLHNDYVHGHKGRVLLY